MAQDPLNARIAACAAGDREAADALIADFYPRVQTIVHRELERDFRQRHRWILPLFSTRDIVQDVFGDVVAGLGADSDFPDEDAFTGYLCTMVRNRLLDAVRHHEAGKRDVRRRVDAASDTMLDGIAPTRHGDAPDLAADLAEQATQLREVLDEFSERHRALLQMRMMDGETFPKIAEQLGYASQETARQAFVEAQAKLLVKLRAKGLGS